MTLLTKIWVPGRLRAALVLAQLALLSCGACGDPEPASLPVFATDGAPRRPNVLVVLVDVLRRDHLGVYGYPLPTSPNIDAFAQESLRFTNAFSHSTWTKPSVATLFTSAYPEQHGLGRVGFEDESGFQTDVLPKRLVTLAERFKRAGYATGAFSTNVHVQRKTGFGQGFERFFWKRLVTAFELNEIFKAWAADLAPDQPFFGYVHYMDVHWPYKQALADESDRFGNTTIDPPPPDRWTQVADWAAEHLNAESLAAIVARYDQEIAYVDAAFGELVDWLRDRQLQDDTVVVFIADHGEGFFEHGELQHGFAPYTEVTGVPLLVRLPPIYDLEPMTIDEIVGLVDVLPTVLDLVNLDVPKRARGRSVVPLLLGREFRQRPVYVEGRGERGMRSTTHSLLVDESGSRRCFDLVADPAELSPLAAEALECDRLSVMLERLTDDLAVAGDAGNAGTTVTLEDDEVDALRALGYLD